MRYIRPKNWCEFQHYTNRSPVWIKLHKRLLDDYEFQSLPVASRALAPMLWLLASEYENGDIPGDRRKIAFRLRMSLEELASAFQPLVNAGFFEIIGDASESLAGCYHDAIPEKEIQVTRDKKEVDTSSLRSDVCAEPSADAEAHAPPPVVTIPTNREGEEYPVTEAQADEFQSLYPGVDVRQQLRAMRGWAISNRTRRKTARGMPKFINAWLSREQDRAGTKPNQRAGPAKLGFVDLPPGEAEAA